MTEQDALATRFGDARAHLRAVAYQMLGSTSEAEDAVQEAWLRLSRAAVRGDTRDVANLRGWLTTVVARVCLDALRARAARREHPLEALDAPRAAGGRTVAGAPATTGGSPAPRDALGEVVLADTVGAALLVVLDTLTPAERLAFVLHDVFAVPFEEIAPVVGRTPAAARQLASRARRRVQGAGAPGGGAPGGGAQEDGVPGAAARAHPVADLARRRRVIDAFLAASREGDFAALLALLDPDVVLRADAAAVQSGAAPEVRGARGVAATFAGRARAARSALVDGAPGAAWAPGGVPRVVFRFTVARDRIAAIELVADPDQLGRLAVILADPTRPTIPDAP